MIPSSQWLALGALTETDRPPEFPVLMQVILNRVSHPSYPSSVYEVLTQRHQFSFFNGFKYVSDEELLYDAVRSAKRLPDPPGPVETVARRAAEAMVAMPQACAILPQSTLNFWSPRSMEPRGSLPRGWRWNELRCFQFPGISATRFVFAETVRPGSLGSGNAELFRFY